ncbi:MAG: superoxide dismutase family protein [Actinobacteria bacterium]|nr:superoxide dismutase family protein [Actinomycetota bacterium]
MRKFGQGSIAVGALVAIVAVALFSGGAVAGSRGLIAPIEDENGDAIGSVRFRRTDDGEVKVRVNARGLAPGFHGFHVHTTGVCDPDAVDTTGNAFPFFTAGGHYNPVTANTHGAHAGDMSPLLVTQDGRAFLRLKTDRFALGDLMDDDGSAVILHASSDNLAHIPATTSTGGERYHSHVDNVLGADTATKATGDAGARFGCGVIERVRS